MTSSPLDPRQLARDADAPLAVMRILFAVADNDPTLVRLIRGGVIDQETMRLRKAVVCVAKWHTSASLPQIGRALARDHSSIQRLIGDAKALYAEDRQFRGLCDRVGQACAGSRRAA